MITLVTGGSKSGKSHIAEEIAAGFDGRKYYLATMHSEGAEAKKAIERHRLMRKDRGFVTLERCTDIAGLETEDEGSLILLECMGNLCANEMFDFGYRPEVVEKIMADVLALEKKTSHLVIVTNEVGADTGDYPEETRVYIKNMGEINAGLAKVADCVIESWFGIPIYLKGERN